MKNQNTIEALNTLITINNDRIQGYETALKETKEQDLKALFKQLARTSEKFKHELVGEVQKLGGKPAEGTKISGKFFREWMDVKAAITGKDRKAILNSCEYGENVAVDTYKKALKANLSDVTPKQKAMLISQHTLIKADHDKLKLMIDALVEA